MFCGISQYRNLDEFILNAYIVYEQERKIIRNLQKDGFMAEFLNLLNIKMNIEQCIHNIILVQSIKRELSD